MRRDISDTLPGVAIAISLVPPLTVVGITLSSGAYQQSLGAFLLFATNVSAIWAVGVVTMALFKVQRLDPTDEEVQPGTVNRREAYVIFAVSIVIIGAILTQSSWSAARSSRNEATIGDVVADWGAPTGWEVVHVETAPDVVTVRLEGPLPPPERGTLRSDLEDAGIDPTTVEIDLVPRYTITMEE